MDSDSFVLSVKTIDTIKDFKNIEDIFDFSNLKKNQELFIIKTKKLIGYFKIETPKNIWINEFICRRSKMNVFKGGVDCKNNLKGVSKTYSENIKFEEYKKCLDDKKYQQECDDYIIRSINHEMYLQKTKKNLHYLYLMIRDVI